MLSQERFSGVCKNGIMVEMIRVTELQVIASHFCGGLLCGKWHPTWESRRVIFLLGGPLDVLEMSEHKSVF